ncbi:MAG: histidine phosphatase family protein [Hellea sp.]|nr:histidine phosphatase family protein [Hellea sp.]
MAEKDQQIDRIVLVRHGLPALSRKVRLTWREYRDWWLKYDEGGLDENQKIPPKVIELAKQADIVISSPLRRAVETATLLRGKPPDLTDPDLVEADLPSPKLGALKLRPQTWGFLARIVWYVGWADGMESHSDARIRANVMAAKLESQATGGKLVLVTAHGWYNRMVKGSLMTQGWKCISQNGDLHWSHRIMERETDYYNER